MMLSQSAIEMAPPFKTVSRYFIFALLNLLMSCIILLIGDSSLVLLDLRVAGIVHLYIIGFVMSVILGALYQLVPVVLESPFYSLKGSSWLFLAFCLGSVGLGYCMLLGSIPLIQGGGGLVYLSLVWFGLLFLASFLHVKRWSIVTLFLLNASIWLLVGVSLGFIALLGISGVDIGFDIFSLIVRHGMVSLVGFVFFVVLGVSLVLLPMFALSHGVSTIYSKVSFVLLNLGLISGFIGQLHVMILSIGIGLLFYILQGVLILKHRMRKKREYWFYHLVFAFVSLFLAILLVFIGFYNGDENIYKIAFWFILVGFGFHFIVGHLYKILPFLIWYEFISPLVGKQKVPMLHEMIDEKNAYLQLILSSFAVIVYGLGLLLHVKVVLVAGAALLLSAAIVLLKVLYKTYQFKKMGEKNGN